MEYELEVMKDIKTFEDKINMEKALDRLSNNPDFIKVISNGFLHDLVLELLYSNETDDNESYHHKLDSIKFFNSYLESIRLEAKIAIQSKAEYEEELKNTK